MVAKGHHFAGIELAGGDRRRPPASQCPIFSRRRERTFSAHHPARGAAAGRERNRGRVIVQTFSARPRARSSHGGATRRRPGSSTEEARSSAARFGYPPFAHLVRIVVTGPRARSRSCGAPQRVEGPGSSGAEAARACAPAAFCVGRYRARSSSRRPSIRGASPHRQRACSRRPAPGDGGAAKLTAFVDVDPARASDGWHASTPDNYTPPPVTHDHAPRRDDHDQRSRRRAVGGGRSAPRWRPTARPSPRPSRPGAPSTRTARWRLCRKNAGEPSSTDDLAPPRRAHGRSDDRTRRAVGPRGEPRSACSGGLFLCSLLTRTARAAIVNPTIGPNAASGDRARPKRAAFSLQGVPRSRRACRTSLTLEGKAEHRCRCTAFELDAVMQPGSCPA